MLILNRQNYEKYPDLFKLNYLTWNPSTNGFDTISNKDFTVKINTLESLSSKEKVALKETISTWMTSIENIPIKKYSSYQDSKNLYTSIADSIDGYVDRFKDMIIINNGGIEDKSKYDYFYCYAKNKNLYLSIGIFSITKKGDDKTATLRLSLAYPESQSVKEKRQKGVFGACGHNNRVSMINHIFLDKSVKCIYSYPENDRAGEALSQLKFN